MDPTDVNAPKTLELPGCASSWTMFRVLAVFVLLWLVFGGYVAGMYAVVITPVVLLVFGLVCVVVTVRSRPGRGLALSVRGMIALVAFLAMATFVATRAGFGFGHSADMRLIVTVLDEGSGRAIPGARVTAVAGDRELASAVTGARGRGTLSYELFIMDKYSWVMAQRSFTPDLVTVEVLADGHAPRRRSLKLPGEVRFRGVDEPFGYPPKTFGYDVEFLLDD